MHDRLLGFISLASFSVCGLMFAAATLLSQNAAYADTGSVDCEVKCSCSKSNETCHTGTEGAAKCADCNCKKAHGVYQCEEP